MHACVILVYNLVQSSIQTLLLDLTIPYETNKWVNKLTADELVRFEAMKQPDTEDKKYHGSV